jgi:uncharacterized protein YwqG
MDKISITHFNNAHNSWVRSLDFYRQEIEILAKQLAEIAKKNTSEKVMKEVDHFENQFGLQVINIRELSHQIKQNLNNVAKEAHQSSAGYVDGALLAEHNALGERFVTEEKIISELRHSFQRFAAEWM